MSLAFFRLAHRSLPRLALIWVLAVALPVHGLSGLLAQMLGAEHRHAAVAQADEEGGWSPKRWLRAVIGNGAMDLIDAVHEQQRGGPMRLPVAKAPKAHAPAAPAHVHTHGLFERHHHDAADGSVVSLGAKESGQDVPGGAAASDLGSPFLLPVAPAAAAWMPGDAAISWRHAAAAAWRSHASTPPEPPPRA